MLFQKRRAAREVRERLAEAEAELLDLRRSIAAAYDVFDHAAEDSLVEASILELAALEAKYSRALRRVKALYAAPETAGAPRRSRISAARA